MHMYTHLYLLGAISKFNPFHHYIFTSLRISTFILILILTPLISTSPSQLCVLKKEKKKLSSLCVPCTRKCGFMYWSVRNLPGTRGHTLQKNEFPSPKPLTDYLQLGPWWGQPCSNPAMSRRHCFISISLNCDSYSLPCCLFCNGPWALG